MTLPFIFHSQTLDGLSFNEEAITVTLKTESLDFDRVYVRSEPDNEEYLTEMHPAGTSGELKLWKATFAPNKDRDVSHYVFKLVLGEQQFWLDGRGVQSRIPPKEFHFKLNVNNQPPTWVQQQIFYQIFPDRFAPSKDEKSIRQAYGEYNPEAIVKSWGKRLGSTRIPEPKSFLVVTCAALSRSWIILKIWA